jgi:CheY-like chemotaxis protein
MKILIIEDDPARIFWFREKLRSICEPVILETADEGARAVRQEQFDIIFLDHDLGGEVFVASEEKNTGYQVALAIPDSINGQTHVIIHSWNPIGAHRIKEVLPAAHRMAFGNFDIITKNNKIEICRK